MRVRFTSLRYRNFVSVGNTWFEWDLTKFSSSIITGTNGEGKSTFLDAITYTLFNKPFREKTPVADLVNNINKKQMVSELGFIIGAHSYKVVRGRKPNVFEIYKDGVLIDQEANAKDQQTYLENDILGMSYKTFLQIVIIGKANFSPFMELSTPDRRNVVETVLDMRIMSEMNAVLKTWEAALSSEMNTAETHLDTVDQSIEIVENSQGQIIEEFKTQIEANNAIIKESGTLGLAAVQKKSDLESKIFEVDAQIKTAEQDMLTHVQYSMNLRNVQANIAKERERYKTLDSLEKCNCCQQDIDVFHRDFLKMKSDEAVVLMLPAVEEWNLKLLELGKPDTQLALLHDQKADLNTELSRAMTEAHTHMIAIQSAKKSNAALQAKIDTFGSHGEDVNKLYSQRDQLKTTLAEGTSKVEAFKYIKRMLKDDGIKAYAIKHYLPDINKYFNEYLELLGFNVRITLDEEFNETISTRPYTNLTYYSFSEGQKARVNLALLLTWRRIAEDKNSVNTNLLILDETFDGSIDAAGTTSFARLLRQLSNDCHVFVISHNEAMIEQFDNHYVVRKTGGFSKLFDGNT